MKTYSLLITIFTGITLLFLFDFCKKENNNANILVHVVNLNNQSISNAKVRFFINSERVDSLNRKTIDSLLITNNDGDVHFSTERECFLDIKCYDPEPHNNVISWCDTMIHLEPKIEKKLTMVIR